MTQKTDKILGFINKNFSVKPNAKWKSIDYRDLIMEAARHNTYVETVKAKKLPDADSFHYRIERDTDISLMQDKFREDVKKNVKNLRGEQTVIIDCTHEPFYGKTKGPWIHEYKPKKGCTGSFKFLVASVLDGDKRLFIDTKPMNVFSNEVKAISDMLDKLKELKVKIKILLIDRGFARNSAILDLLNNRRISYLGLYPKYENVKKIIQGMDEKFLRTNFKVKGISTKLIVIRDKHDWSFVTNVEFKRIWRYIIVYRKRWNIETGFRVQDEARIKSKSLDIRVRYFLFLVAMLLYNIWKELDFEVVFKRLVINFQAICGGVLDEGKTT